MAEAAILERAPKGGLIDACALRAELASLAPASAPQGVLEVMKARLRDGRAAIRASFEAGGTPDIVHRELGRQMDALIQGALDHASRHLFYRANPTTGEQIAVVAVGGYGRNELAPASDVDLVFLYPYKRSPYVEQMVEFLLLKLWDLGLKVGHATRSVAESMRLAREDMLIRTSLLEARFLWGDEGLFADFQGRFRREVVAGTAADFIEAKLAERDQRHQAVGDSRYLLEPNVKEGKGGLRDLHTLWWIGKDLFGVEAVDDLVAQGVLTCESVATFKRSSRFLRSVRCHLHYLTGRGEERLTFDLQPEVARRMGFRDRPRGSAVERFMKRYYLVAKDVGGLTRIVCAALEEQHRRRPTSRTGRPGRRVDGFLLQGARLALATPDMIAKRPLAMLELFRTAQEYELDIHPAALAAVQQNLRRIDASLREDPLANALFLAILCSRHDPALTLTRMNEAGVLGRFLPDFGRIIAQMQHNLYHVYTVDEHTIRAIDGLTQMERGLLEEELPLSTRLISSVLSRTELFVATFLHDIGKGRGGDHSSIGAEIARRVCRRLGLGEAASETVVWLVQNHLLMTHYAFKRDPEDPKTIQDFIELVQSPERLRLLLLLTTADIRAVGPNVWNGWKGQLLRDLYNEAAAAMASGDPQGRLRERITGARDALAGELAALPDGAWEPAAVERYLQRHDPRYWLGLPVEDHLRHALLIHRAEEEGAPLVVDLRVDRFRARTELVLYAPDHAGLFMEIAGALAVSGVSIVDARIFTTVDGMALDLLGLQDAGHRAAVEDPERHARIRRNIRRALAGELRFEQALAGRRTLPERADVFQVEPRVLVDNTASRTHTVIELNGRDRPGLLFDVAKALRELGLVINSAHISTYGERVVDVFYVKDIFGMKITQRPKLARIERRLVAALAQEPAAEAAWRFVVSA